METLSLPLNKTVRNRYDPCRLIAIEDDARRAKPKTKLLTQGKLDEKLKKFKLMEFKIETDDIETPITNINRVNPLKNFHVKLLRLIEW